jgi:hypothetical protein
MDPKYFDQIKEARKTADLVKKIKNDEVVVLDDDLILVNEDTDIDVPVEELNDTIETFLMELEMEEAANNDSDMHFGIARELAVKKITEKIHKTAEKIVKLPEGWTLEALVAGGSKQLDDMMEILVGKDNLPEILNTEE